MKWRNIRKKDEKIFKKQYGYDNDKIILKKKKDYKNIL